MTKVDPVWILAGISLAGLLWQMRRTELEDAQAREDALAAQLAAERARIEAAGGDPLALAPHVWASPENPMSMDSTRDWPTPGNMAPGDIIHDPEVYIDRNGDIGPPGQLYILNPLPGGARYIPYIPGQAATG